VLLTVAYDGRSFSGFAPQPEARTVAGELLLAVRALDGGVTRLRGASRTDAGVHARGQRVAFDASASLPTRAWVLGLAPHLPEAIAVQSAERVGAGFDPRAEAVSKRYRYLLLCAAARDPFLAGRAWHLPELALRDPRPCLELLAGELAAARGRHDFSAFAAAADARRHRERTLLETAVVPLADARVLALDVRGDGFLHHMVRILVGTAVDVARGRLAAGAVARALASRARADAGVTAPPDGLYLEEVELRSGGVERWPGTEPTDR
jgi:tRNA pseudouridine38-40 synthase